MQAVDQKKEHPAQKLSALRLVGAMSRSTTMEALGSLHRMENSTQLRTTHLRHEVYHTLRADGELDGVDHPDDIDLSRFGEVREYRKHADPE